MKLIKCFLLIFFYSLASCKQNNLVQNGKIVVETAETIPISHLVEPVVLFPLETNDSIHIIRSDKLAVIGKDVFTLDEQQNTLYVFDTVGRYVKKLSRVGRGPGEYIMLNDFCFDEQTGNVMILDSYSARIKVYDKEFNYIKEIKLPSGSINHIQYVNDSLIALYSMSEGMAILYNHLNEEEVENLVISNEEIEFRTPFKAHSSPFVFYDGEACLLASARKEIYRITPDGFKSKYTFSFGENEGDPFSIEIPDGRDITSLVAFNRKMNELKEVYAITFYNETEEFIYLSYNNFSNNYYNKKSGLWMKIDGIIAFNVRYNNSLYGLSSLQSLKYAKENGYIKISDEQWSKVLALSEDSNPILLSYKLK